MGLFNNWPYLDEHKLNLDWVIKTVRLLADEWAHYYADWDQWKNDTDAAFNSLHDYVMDYFNNLDLTTEVSNKINQMAADGSLAAIIRPLLTTYQEQLDVLEARVDNLTETITPGSTSGDAEIIDIRVGWDGTEYDNAGNAVRAQVTELHIEDDKISALINREVIDWDAGRISTNTDPVDITNITALDTWYHVAYECTEGDIFNIKVLSSATAYRPYCFIDTNGHPLLTAGVTIFNGYVKAPTGATMLICNTNNSGSIVVKVLGKTHLNNYIDKNGGWCGTSEFFEIGLWRVQNNVVSVLTSRIYQIHSSFPFTTDKRLSLRAKEGYQLGVLYDNGSGQWTDTGWTYNYVADAGSTFYLNINKIGADQSVSADIEDLLGAIEFRYDLINPLDGPFWYNGKLPVSMHRGYKGEEDTIPENSTESFIAAGKLGMLSIETDLRETSDGYFVCMHDSTINRTTTGSGAVANMTLAQIQSYTLIGDNTLTVPTIEEFLAICKQYRAIPNIEIKGTLNSTSSLKKIVELIEAYGFTNNCLLIASIATLRALRQYNISIPIFVLNDDDGSQADYSDILNTLKHLENVGVSYTMNTTLLTPEIIQAAHALKIAVGAYFTNQETWVKYWLGAGVDIITSNKFAGYTS